MIERNNLDSAIQNSESFGIFQKHFLNFLKLSPINYIELPFFQWSKTFTCLHLGLLHLCEYKFKYWFQAPWWLLKRFHLFHSSSYFNKKVVFLGHIRKSDASILQTKDSSLIRILIFSGASFTSY